MKNKMIFWGFIIVLILVFLIGVFLSRNVFNKASITNNKTNSLLNRNILEANKNDNVLTWKEYHTNILDFNVENYLNKKEKEWKQLWNLSDEKLYELLKNDIKFEQKYKIDDLCNYLFYWKDDYKLRKCLGMSYKVIRDIIDILTYRLGIHGYGDKDVVYIYKNIGNKEKILNILSSSDKTWRCIYKFLVSWEYFRCKEWKDDIGQYNASLIFFWLAAWNQPSDLPDELKKIYYNKILGWLWQNNKESFLIHSNNMIWFSYLLITCKTNIICIKKVFNDRILAFVKVFKNEFLSK